MPMMIDGDAVEQVRHIPHDERKSPSSELGQVDPAQEPDRHTDHGGQQQQFAAAEDRVGHAAARFPRRAREAS